MRGAFVINPDTPQEERIWNTLMPYGKEYFLKMVFQDDATITDYYCGLMGETYDQDTVLSDIVGVTEPTIGVNGYARETLTRDATDWADIAEVNGIWRARSVLMTFTATGGDFDKDIYRLFLCDVATGSVGNMIAVSGAYASAKTVTVAAPLPVKYELWLPN